MGKTIGVVSLKGGVGKTSSVAALGAALADFSKKVLLVDANFSAPNLGIHLNVIDPEVTIHHVLNRTSNVKDSIQNVGNMDLIPASMFSNLEINPFKLKERLNFLKRAYDFILIDSSPSLRDETLAAMLASDELLAVTTPDYSTLSTTIKAVKSANQRGHPIKGLILNKVYNQDFELSLKEIEDTAGVPVVAVIPHDINVLRAQAEFVPSVDFKPRSSASVEFKKLAASMIGEKYKPFSFKNFLRITPKRQDVNRELLYHRVFKE